MVSAGDEHDKSSESRRRELPIAHHVEWCVPINQLIYSSGTFETQRRSSALQGNTRLLVDALKSGSSFHPELRKSFVIARYIDDPIVLGIHPATGIMAKTLDEKIILA